jgi:hypothetical protein
MNIDIFTEGSSTLRENPTDDSVAQYFGGGFMSVTSIADELSEHGDPEIYVISEELGFVRGSDEVPEHSGEELEMKDFVDAKRAFREQMVESASGVDVLVLLFTKDMFRTAVSSNWKQLVDAAKPGTTWCIATSGKAFDTVDMNLLREKGIEPILYERVGVARIGNETREELIEQIDG